MFKLSYESTVDGLTSARSIMAQIYQENPKHWPYGLSPEHFDGGVYLIREKQSNTPVGFCGWQERWVRGRSKRSAVHSVFGDCEKVGYYSIGILPEYRRNRFAKEALAKLISVKAAGVDRVQALIMSDNTPSLALADSLGVEKQVKQATSWLPSNWRFWRKDPPPRSWTPELAAGVAGASLPLTALHQYHNRDLPMLTKMIGEAPIMSMEQMRKRIRFGDIGLEGEMGPHKGLSGDAARAKAYQGTPLYHGFAVGDHGRLYHGGGHSIYDASVRDTLGRTLTPIETIIKKYGGNRTKMWNDLRSGRLFQVLNRESGHHNKQWAKQMAELRRIQKDPKAWARFQQKHVSTFKNYYKNYPFETAMFLRPDVKLNTNMRNGVREIYRNMSGVPYSMSRAVLSGLRNILIPNIPMAHTRTIPRVTPLPTSMCGELPAAACRAMGINNRPLRTALPIDIMSNPMLKPIGIASKLPADKARAQIMSSLISAAQLRTQRGMAGALGLGGLAAGLVASRRLREQK